MISQISFSLNLRNYYFPNYSYAFHNFKGLSPCAPNLGEIVIKIFNIFKV
jgi:hypothetical protein